MGKLRWYHWRFYKALGQSLIDKRLHPDIPFHWLWNWQAWRETMVLLGLKSVIQKPECYPNGLPKTLLGLPVIITKRDNGGNED